MPSCAHVAHGTHVGEQHPVAECDRHVVGKATEPQEQVALRTAKVATMAISSPPPSTVMNVARWSRRCSGEEKGWKERDEAWCCGSAAAGSGSDHLLALALGDGLDDGPLALDRGKRATVEIVDVRPDVQFPIIIDKRGCCGGA